MMSYFVSEHLHELDRAGVIQEQPCDAQFCEWGVSGVFCHVQLLEISQKTGETGNRYSAMYKDIWSGSWWDFQQPNLIEPPFFWMIKAGRRSYHISSDHQRLQLKINHWRDKWNCEADFRWCTWPMAFHWFCLEDWYCRRAPLAPFGSSKKPIVDHI